MSSRLLTFHNLKSERCLKWKNYVFFQFPSNTWKSGNHPSNLSTIHTKIIYHQSNAHFAAPFSTAFLILYTGVYPMFRDWPGMVTMLASAFRRRDYKSVTALALYACFKLLFSWRYFLSYHQPKTCIQNRTSKGLQQRFKPFL